LLKEKKHPLGNRSRSWVCCTPSPTIARAKRWLVQEHRIDGIAITELSERRSTGRKPKRRPAMFANGALRYTRPDEYKKYGRILTRITATFGYLAQHKRQGAQCPTLGRRGMERCRTASWTLLTCGPDRVPRGEFRRPEQGSEAFAEAGGHSCGSCKRCRTSQAGWRRARPGRRRVKVRSIAGILGGLC